MQAPPIQSEDAIRDAAHREHVAWLQAQHADLHAHRSLEASMRESMRSEEEDFSAETPVGFTFEADETFSTQEEGPRYRSLSDASHLDAAISPEVEVHEEALVYRSLPSLARETSEQSTSSDADADRSWLAAGRPPLLQRQRAFNRGHTQTDWWLNP